MQVRKAEVGDADGIARVHVVAWRHSYRELLPQSFLEALDVGERTKAWAELLRSGTQCVYVAEDVPGSIVAFASAGPEQFNDPVFTGEMFTLYALPEHQGFVLGRWLMSHLAAGLAEAGHSRVALRVLRDNPTRRFFEALGGRFHGEKTVEIGGRELVEVTLVWDDVSVLELPQGR